MQATPFFMIGFMAAGKSSLGALLALLLDLPFRDLDKEIEARTGQTAVDLFARGESHFRQEERAAFDSLMADGFHGILALGAGFPVQDGAEELLRASGHCLFLDPDFDAILERLEAASGQIRPLATQQEAESPAAFSLRMKALWSSRREIYMRLAQPIQVPSEDPTVVLDHLLDAVHRRGH
jgi:shikimate kinase